jgi:probable phosphoglycerate mutase
LQAFIRNVDFADIDALRELRYCDNTAVMTLTVDNERSDNSSERHDPKPDRTQFVIEAMNDNSHLSEEISTFAQQSWWKSRASTDKRNIYFEHLVEDGAFTAMFYGEPCGHLKCRPGSGADSNAVWISELFLNEEYRNRGFGPQLLGQAVSFARNAGRTVLYATIPGEDALAEKFSKRCGFVKVSGNDTWALKL